MPAVRDILPTKLRLAPNDKADYQTLFWSLTGQTLKLTNDAFQAAIYTLPPDRVVTSYIKRNTQYIALTSRTLCLKAKVSKDRKDEWLAALSLPTPTSASLTANATDDVATLRRATMSSQGSDHAYASNEIGIPTKAREDSEVAGAESLEPLAPTAEQPRRMGRMRRSSVV